MKSNGFEISALQSSVLASALTDAHTSALLASKSQALETVLHQSIPCPPELLRAELEAVILAGGQLETERSQRAARMASLLLDELDGIGQEMPIVYSWEQMDDPVHWLSLMVGQQIETLMDWSIEQVEWVSGSPRVQWIGEQAREIMRSEDPLSAMREFFASPATPPAGL